MSMQETTRDMSPAAVRARLRNPANAVPDLGYGVVAPKPQAPIFRMPTCAEVQALARAGEEIEDLKAKNTRLRCQLVSAEKQLAAARSSDALTQRRLGTKTKVASMRALKDEIARPLIRLIYEEVCNVSEITYAELCGCWRAAPISRARHIAVWLCRTMGVGSFPLLGHEMGGKDHTTMLHGYRRIEAERQTNPALQALLDKLLAAFREEPEASAA